MYVELYGNESQKKNDLPAKVYLKVRHSTASYFRDGNGVVREFRQPLAASCEDMNFNRFAITDTAKCNAEKKKGNSK